ncbi:lipocalin-like domain-containing protein [Ramlibacter rhizophilus]|uniref:Carotenoid 1,2-hydratase n=1 Tax=Ramlibacter rhizophilus TaxID=1781167 RepID=A0A4Z0C1V8_9BURK|nr:carotenoid 1,2-hydratase [Ramlibacter rhizophilus]TFZ04225.1 carotenoid 1,2-hydratase [Ramlibacter rhizophilus]
MAHLPAPHAPAAFGLVLSRRQALALLAGAAARPAWALPPRQLAFPRDHGAHPGFRTEWWYITGHLRAGTGRDFGFQVTFFRTRVDAAQAIESRFAARQLIFAHAAVTDLDGQRLLHDQRIARAGFGIAEAAEDDTRVRLRDWQLERGQDGRYHALVPAEGFTLDLRFEPTQPLLLQGAQGLSRKGPQASQASYYYSQPQMRASGLLRVAGREFEGTGRAWLDHEWSEELLHPDAVGWDWVGMNLDDGGALTAFRLRRADGSAVWDGGSFRAPGQPVRAFDAGHTVFTPITWWTSPRSKARYPVTWRLQCPAGDFTVRALLVDQELDSRASTGAVYWEGLSELLDAQGRRVGTGYLEMTGYVGPLRLGG